MALYNQPSFDDVRELFSSQSSAVTLYKTFKHGISAVEKKSLVLQELKTLLKEVSTYHFPSKEALSSFQARAYESVEEELKKVSGHGRSIAVFVSQNLTKVFSLPNRLGNHVQVKDTFFLPPIFRAFAFSYAGYVLVAGKDGWELFYGSDTDEVKRLELEHEGVSSALDAANKLHDVKHQIQRSVKDTLKDAIGIYAKRVAEKVSPVVNGGELLLVADTPLLSELTKHFPEAMKLEKSISTSTSLAELDNMLRKALADKHAGDVKKLGLEMDAAMSKGLLATDLADIAVASVSGRVSKLIMHYDYSEHGRIDMETGALLLDTRGELSHDLVVNVAEHKGIVLAFRPEEVNGALGEHRIAAILRF
jgi:hypothetical protein